MRRSCCEPCEDWLKIGRMPESGGLGNLDNGGTDIHSAKPEEEEACGTLT